MIKRSYTPMADINVTNLVDVILVLLIIFMITAPMLQSGIDINLPQTRAAIQDEVADGVVLTIDNKGGIFIDDIWVNLPEFEKTLDRILSDKNSSSVYIRADSGVLYGKVVAVIARVKELGIDYLSLVTSPIEDGKKRRGK